MGKPTLNLQGDSLPTCPDIPCAYEYTLCKLQNSSSIQHCILTLVLVPNPGKPVVSSILMDQIHFSTIHTYEQSFVKMPERIPSLPFSHSFLPPPKQAPYNKNKPTHSDTKHNTHHSAPKPHPKAHWPAQSRLHGALINFGVDLPWREMSKARIRGGGVSRTFTTAD